ncbi:hypothetical protein D9M70_513940 [compost metagenome]
MRIAAGEHQLYRAEEALVEDFFLVGDELAHPVGHFHRTALEFQHRDGDAVYVQHDVRAALVAPFERHLLGQGKIVLVGAGPIDQMHLVVGPTGCHLHIHPVAQQLVGAQVGLVEGDAGGVGGRFQLLQCGGDVGVGVAPGQEVGPQQGGFDGTVALPLTPFAQVVVAEIRARLVRKEFDDAVLGDALGAELFRHWQPR